MSDNSSYHSQTAKFLSVLAQNMPNLSACDMQYWIERPGDVRCALARALMRDHDLKTYVWKTLKLGTGLRNADDFRRALKRGGFRIGDWANDILGKPAFKAATEECEVDLVVVSVAELGFKKGATRQDIYKQAVELGLELCPAEVGPQLRLQYGDQPMGEWLFIGMEPISDSGGDLGVFLVGRDDGDQWLYGGYGSPVGVWYGSDRWVFLRRK